MEAVLTGRLWPIAPVDWLRLNDAVAAMQSFMFGKQLPVLDTWVTYVRLKAVLESHCLRAATRSIFASLSSAEWALGIRTARCELD